MYGDSKGACFKSLRSAEKQQERIMQIGRQECERRVENEVAARKRHNHPQERIPYEAGDDSHEIVREWDQRSVQQEKQRRESRALAEPRRDSVNRFFKMRGYERSAVIADSIRGRIPEHDAGRRGQSQEPRVESGGGERDEYHMIRHAAEKTHPACERKEQEEYVCVLNADEFDQPFRRIVDEETGCSEPDAYDDKHGNT